MKIYVNCSLFNTANWSGAERYAFHLLLHLVKATPESQYYLHFGAPRAGLSADEASYLELLAQHPNTSVLSYPGKWRHNFALAWNLMRFRPDWYLVLGGEKIRFSLGARRAYTMLDCGQFMVPGYYPPCSLSLARQETAARLHSSDLVLTISETVKAEITNLFNLQPDRVVVASPAVCVDDRISGAPAGSGAFFLLVNPGRAYKNWRDAMEAFHLLRSSRGDALGLTMIVVGDLRDQAAGIASWLAAHPETAAEVRCLGHVSDAELAGLYARARWVVIPSRYEGFGIPVLEAMQAGLPVVLSDVPVFREVAGSAALFAPLDRPEELAAQFRRLLEEPELSRELVDRGRERVALYSWAQSAVAVHQKMLSLRRRPRVSRWFSLLATPQGR